MPKQLNANLPGTALLQVHSLGLVEAWSALAGVGPAISRQSQLCQCGAALSDYGQYCVRDMCSPAVALLNRRHQTIILASRIQHVIGLAHL